MLMSLVLVDATCFIPSGNICQALQKHDNASMLDICEIPLSKEVEFSSDIGEQTNNTDCKKPLSFVFTSIMWVAVFSKIALHIYICYTGYE